MIKTSSSSEDEPRHLLVKRSSGRGWLWRVMSSHWNRRILSFLVLSVDWRFHEATFDFSESCYSMKYDVFYPVCYVVCLWFQSGVCGRVASSMKGVALKNPIELLQSGRSTAWSEGDHVVMFAKLNDWLKFIQYRNFWKWLCVFTAELTEENPEDAQNIQLVSPTTQVSQLISKITMLMLWSRSLFKHPNRYPKRL